MDLNFTYDEVKASDRLEQLTTDKLNKLVDKYDFIIRADVIFRKENTSEPNTGMVCTIRLNVPGPSLFAEASQGEFQKSVLKVIDDLDRQLRRKKEKMKSH